MSGCKTIEVVFTLNSDFLKIFNEFVKSEFSLELNGLNKSRFSFLILNSLIRFLTLTFSKAVFFFFFLEKKISFKCR